MVKILTTLLEFLGPMTKPEVVYSANSKELKDAKQELGSLLASSTPHIPQTSGIAENCVRKVKEATSCLLDQSGLSHAFWCDAMRCFCFLKNITTIGAVL